MNDRMQFTEVPADLFDPALNLPAIGEDLDESLNIFITHQPNIGEVKNYFPDIVEDLDKEKALEHYRVAYLAMCINEARRSDKAAGKASFAMWSDGQELARVVFADAQKPGDLNFDYYRSGPGQLVHGITNVRAEFLQLFGHLGPEEIHSSGRHMPHHLQTPFLGSDGSRRDMSREILEVAPISSTGWGVLMAAGAGKALQTLQFQEGDQSPRANSMIHCSVGDGSMGEAIALDGVAKAVADNSAIGFIVYDNGRAISVGPNEAHAVPHDDILKACAGFAPQNEGGPGLKLIGPVDAWDYPALLRARDEMERHVRDNKQPALVRVVCSQLNGHSSTSLGACSLIKTPEELQSEGEFHAINRFRLFLEKNGIDSDALSGLEQGQRNLVANEKKRAWEIYYQPILKIAQHIQLAVDNLLKDIETSDPGSETIKAVVMPIRLALRGGSFIKRHDLVEIVKSIVNNTADLKDCESRKYLVKLDTALQADMRKRLSSDVYAPDSHSAAHVEEVLPSYDDGVPDEATMAYILNAALATRLGNGEFDLYCGEDAGRHGGVKAVTHGWRRGVDDMYPNHAKMPPRLKAILERVIPNGGHDVRIVFDTQIDEPYILAIAAAASLLGLRPIVEIQYEDYLSFGQFVLSDFIATLRHRTAGGQSAPALIRIHGQDLTGYQHAGNHVADIMTSCSGVMLAVSRNAAESDALHGAALQGDDPVVIIDPLKRLDQKEPIPSNLGETAIRFGDSELFREGEDVTIVTYGHYCYIAEDAANELEEAYGVKVEIVNLRSLNPIDLNNVAFNSIMKTGNVLFLDGSKQDNGVMAFVQNQLLYQRKIRSHHPTLGDSVDPLINYIHQAEILAGPDHGPPFGFTGKSTKADVVRRLVSMMHYKTQDPKFDLGLPPEEVWQEVDVELGSHVASSPGQVPSPNLNGWLDEYYEDVFGLQPEGS